MMNFAEVEASSYNKIKIKREIKPLTLEKKKKTMGGSLGCPYVIYPCGYDIPHSKTRFFVRVYKKGHGKK